MELEYTEGRDECAICLEPTQNPVLFACHAAKLCYACFRTCVETEVRSMSFAAGKNLRCPVCESKQIPFDEALLKLAPHDCEQVNEILLEKYLRGAADVERCPLSSCSFAYLPERCLVRKEQSCPLCFSSLHSRFVLSLTPLITFVYITFMTNNCPRCEIPIDRISGCYHMTCSCSHEFCWYCLKDYKHSAGSRYRQHAQKDCLFLLLTKFVVAAFFAFGLAFAAWGSEAFDAAVAYCFKVCLGVLRAFAIDGAIAVQLVVLNHNAHRRNNLRRLGLLFLGMDLLALFVLYLIGDLAVTMYILGVSLMVAGVVGWVGISVEYSVNTWFNYIR